MSAHKEPNNLDKWRYSLYSALVFILLALPITFKITSYAIPAITSSNGCPSILGVVIHGVVFLLIVRLMMNFKI